MKANADKCHLLSTKGKLTANVSNFKITNSNKDNLLGGGIGNQLNLKVI